jgi:hypothetical protein
LSTGARTARPQTKELPQKAQKTQKRKILFCEFCAFLRLTDPKNGLFALRA